MAKQIIERSWRIYKVTCMVTEKSYIGLTCDTVPQRWNNHNCQARRSNMLLHRAIRKYGKPQFYVQTLCEVASLEEASAAEIAAINLHQTMNPLGYNLSTGGMGTPGVRGRHSDETKAKISKAHTGKTIPAESRAKMSKAKKIIGMQRKAIERSAELRRGKALSIEVRQKITSSTTGRTVPLRSIAILRKRLADPASDRGIHKEGHRWHARIGINGKRTYVGIFDTKEEARLAHRGAVEKRIAELERMIQNVLPSASVMESNPP